jgi:hypothetical protein
MTVYKTSILEDGPSGIFSCAIQVIVTDLMNKALCVFNRQLGCERASASYRRTWVRL